MDDFKKYKSTSGLSKIDKKKILDDFLNVLLEEIFNKSIIVFKKLPNENEDVNKDNEKIEKQGEIVDFTESPSQIYKVMMDLIKIKEKKIKDGFVIKLISGLNLIGLLNNNKIEKDVFLNLNEVKELIKGNEKFFFTNVLNLLDMYGSDYVSNSFCDFLIGNEKIKDKNILSFLDIKKDNFFDFNDNVMNVVNNEFNTKFYLTKNTIIINLIVKKRYKEIMEYSNNFLDFLSLNEYMISKNNGGEDIENIKNFTKTISRLKCNGVDISELINKIKNSFKEIELNRMFLRSFIFIGENKILETIKNKDELKDKNFTDVFKENIEINHMNFSIDIGKIMNIYNINNEKLIMSVIGFIIDGVVSVYKDDIVYAKYIKDKDKNNIVNIKIGLDTNQLNKEVLMKLIENVLNMYDKTMLWKNFGKVELVNFFKVEWFDEIKRAESDVMSEKMKKVEDKIETRKNKI